MRYEIHLLSDWHIGSGLSAGAESDAEVLKDDDNLPYIPGKTIKGLLKDALMEIPNMDEGIINGIFGYEEKDKQGNVIRTYQGSAYFSNASLAKDEQEEITPTMAEFLYTHQSSIEINDQGVAENKSLRTMEVCMPVVLKGEINNLENEEQINLLKKALKWVRHLGVNRNRGLGRCQFKLTD